MILHQKNNKEFPLSFIDADIRITLWNSSFPQKKKMTKSPNQHRVFVPPWSPTKQPASRNDKISVSSPRRRSKRILNECRDAKDKIQTLPKAYHESFEFNIGIDSFLANSNQFSPNLKDTAKVGRSRSFEDSFAYISHAATKSHADSTMSNTDTLSTQEELRLISSPDIQNSSNNNSQQNSEGSNGSIGISEVFPETTLETVEQFEDYDKSFSPLALTLSEIKEKHKNIVVLNSLSFSGFSAADSMLPNFTTTNPNDEISTADNEFLQDKAKSGADFVFEEPDWANSSCSGDEINFNQDGLSPRKRRNGGKKKKKISIKVKASDLDKIPENLDELKKLLKNTNKDERNIGPVQPNNGLSKLINSDALITTSITTESTVNTSVSSLSSTTFNRVNEDHLKGDSPRGNETQLKRSSPRANGNLENFCYPDEWHQSRKSLVLDKKNGVKDAVSIDLLIDDNNDIIRNEPTIVITSKTDRPFPSANGNVEGKKIDLKTDILEGCENNSEREGSMSFDDIFIVNEVASASEKKKQEWRSEHSYLSKSLNTKFLQKSNESSTMIMAPFRSAKRSKNSSQKIRHIIDSSLPSIDVTSRENQTVDSSSVQQPSSYLKHSREMKPQMHPYHSQQNLPSFEYLEASDNLNNSKLSRSRLEIDTLYKEWKSELKYNDRQGQSSLTAMQFSNEMLLDESQLLITSPCRDQDSYLQRKYNRVNIPFHSDPLVEKLQPSPPEKRAHTEDKGNYQRGTTSHRRRSMAEPNALSSNDAIIVSRETQKANRSKSAPRERTERSKHAVGRLDSVSEIGDAVRKVHTTRPKSSKKQIEGHDLMLENFDEDRNVVLQDTREMVQRDDGLCLGHFSKIQECTSKAKEENGEKQFNRPKKKRNAAEQRSHSRSRSEVAENGSSAPDSSENRSKSITIPKHNQDRISRPSANDKRANSRGRTMISEQKISDTGKISERRSVSRSQNRKDEANEARTRTFKSATVSSSPNPVAATDMHMSQSSSLSKSRHGKKEEHAHRRTKIILNVDSAKDVGRSNRSFAVANEIATNKEVKRIGSKSSSATSNKVRQIVQLGSPASDSHDLPSNANASASKITSSRSRYEVVPESPRKSSRSFDQSQIQSKAPTRTSRSRSRSRSNERIDHKVKTILSDAQGDEEYFDNQKRQSTYGRRRSVGRKERKTSIDKDDKIPIDREQNSQVGHERSLADRKQKKSANTGRATDLDTEEKSSSIQEKKSSASELKQSSAKQESKGYSFTDARLGSPKRSSSRAKARTEECPQDIEVIRKGPIDIDTERSMPQNRSRSRSRSRVHDVPHAVTSQDRSAPVRTNGEEVPVSPQRRVQRSISTMSESKVKNVTAARYDVENTSRGREVTTAPRRSRSHSRSRSQELDAERFRAQLASESPRRQGKSPAEPSAASESSRREKKGTVQSSAGPLASANPRKEPRSVAEPSPAGVDNHKSHLVGKVKKKSVADAHGSSSKNAAKK